MRASISGTLSGDAAIPPGTKAGLLWLAYDLRDSEHFGATYMGEVAAVETGFPARFDLDLYAVPPERATIGVVPGIGLASDPTGAIPKLVGDSDMYFYPPVERWGWMAIAYIAVLSPDADGESIDRLVDARVLGIASELMVAYVERDMQPNGTIIPGLGFPLSPGYHLFKVSWKLPDGSTGDPAVGRQCVDAGEAGPEGKDCGYPVLADVPLDTAMNVHLGARDVLADPLDQDFTDDSWL